MVFLPNRVQILLKFKQYWLDSAHPSWHCLVLQQPGWSSVNYASNPRIYLGALWQRVLRPRLEFKSGKQNRHWSETGETRQQLLTLWGHYLELEIRAKGEILGAIIGHMSQCHPNVGGYLYRSSWIPRTFNLRQSRGQESSVVRSKGVVTSLLVVSFFQNVSCTKKQSIFTVFNDHYLQVYQQWRCSFV